jgi:lysozyme
MRNLTPEALDHIKRCEGLRLNVYRDSAGHRTIGYGHKIRPDETFGAITAEKALELLSTDVRPHCVTVSSMVKVYLNDNEFGACVSLSYNIGTNGFAGSTLVKRLNNGEPKETVAREEFPRWNKITKRVNGQAVKVVSPGLVNRRTKDLAFFLRAPGGA